MARYINLDEAIKHLQFDCKAKYPISYCNGISVAIREIGKLPTADVVPKSEVERLSHKCDDCAGCTQWKCDCANIKLEVAREIFEEIDVLIDDWKHCRIQSIQFIAELAELKKKYTEGEE